MAETPLVAPVHIRLTAEQMDRLRDCRTASRAVLRTDVTCAAIVRRALDLGLAALERELHLQRSPTA